MLNEIKAPNDDGKLRDHLANERTFLAWTRSSLGIMAFGFVVEKFSLFLKEISTLLGKPNFSHTPIFLKGSSSFLGILLVALGALICILSFFKYKKIESQIDKGDFQRSEGLNILLTSSILFIGIILVIYLCISI